MTDGDASEPRDGPNVQKHGERERHTAIDEDSGSELEPKDSRNVTGTAKTKDGRWTGAAVRPEDGPRIPKAK
jgi:hypothetical protein